MHADDHYEDARPQRAPPPVPAGCRDVGGTVRYFRQRTDSGEWILADDRMTYWRPGACTHPRDAVALERLPPNAPPEWRCSRCGTMFYTPASLRHARLQRLRHCAPNERMQHAAAWGMTTRDLRDAPAYVDVCVPVPKLPANWRKA